MIYRYTHLDEDVQDLPQQIWFSPDFGPNVHLDEWVHLQQVWSHMLFS